MKTRLTAVLILLVGAVAVYQVNTNQPKPDAPKPNPPPPPVVKLSLDEELQNSVTRLATEIGVRNLVHHAALNEAADWIESEFANMGYVVQRQSYQVEGLDCHNLIVEKKGTEWPDEIVIVGAHYDTFRDSPGANDNGTGIAATLALARKFVDRPSKRTIRFAAFTNEEPPYFQFEGDMGSWVYARQCRKNDDQIVVAIILETMGYFSDEPHSQHYPAPLNLMYPSTGNFIGFVSNLDSREQVTAAVKSFKQSSDIPVEFATLPEFVQGVGWSDHWSFWQEGYPGFMVTDTAPFRYPHYHEATDTADKVNFQILARVVEGLVSVIGDFADREPLPPESDLQVTDEEVGDD